MSSVGDVVIQDGKEMAVTEVQVIENADGLGTTVTVVTTEPV